MIRRRRPQRIVFVGCRNDARSQMAEGFARRRFEPTQFIFRSAGISPTRLSPWAVLVMDEVGIDIAGNQSTALDSIVASNVDKLIFVEPGLKAPPRFHGIRRIDWRIEDPNAVALSSDAMVRNFRAARDQLAALVEGLRQPDGPAMAEHHTS